MRFDLRSLASGSTLEEYDYDFFQASWLVERHELFNPNVYVWVFKAVFGQVLGNSRNFDELSHLQTIHENGWNEFEMILLLRSEIRWTTLDDGGYPNANSLRKSRIREQSIVVIPFAISQSAYMEIFLLNFD